MKSKRLALRAPTLVDTANYFAIHSDPQTNLFNPFGAMTDKAQAEAALAYVISHWQQHGFGIWAVAEKDNPEQIIGYGGLSFKLYSTTERLNLSFRFTPSTWGKGYASELADFAVNFAFATLNKPDVFGLVRPEHTASIRVLEKCGMSLYGELEDVPEAAPSWVYCISRDKS